MGKHGEEGTYLLHRLLCLLADLLVLEAEGDVAVDGVEASL